MPRPSRIVYPARSKPRQPFPKRFFWFAASILAAAVLIAAFWYIANLAYFRVEHIKVGGTALFTSAEVEEALRKEISGEWFGVIPKNNFLFVSSRRLQMRIEEAFPQASEIKVEKEFPDKLAVTVKERTLWGVYCSRSGPAPAPQSCFYLDSRGAAYEKLSYFEGWLLPVIYGGSPAVLGEQAVPADTLEFFQNADKAASAVGGDVISLELSTSTPDDARLGMAEGWEVWVTRTRPPEEWLKVLAAVLEKEIGPQRAQLDYMDLRFGNKVFYKYR